jgi:hypothetical protein
VAQVTDHAGLEGWVQPQHLEAGAVRSLHSRFTGHPARLLRVSDFLRPEIAARIGDFLCRQAEFERTQGLLARNGPASREEWEATPDAGRLFTFERLVGPRPEARLSPGFIQFARLRKALEAAACLEYFGQLTGLTLEALSGFTVQSLGPGDYLRPHQDAFAQRKLAFILYLNSRWEPGFGGALRVVDHAGAEHVLEVEYNSLVLFDVHTHEHHEILPIHPAAGDERRITVGGWYGSLGAPGREAGHC